MIVDTSTGAINAALVAAAADRDAEEAAHGLVQGWSLLERDDVFRSFVFHQAPLTAVRYLGEVLGVPGIHLSSLLDPTPLRATLDRLIDWPAVHRNVRGGALDCVAVAASDAANPRSVVFVEGADKRRLPSARTIEYVPAELSGEHVLASTALPVLFPAVRVEQPVNARGWYYDGATRLNTPVKPALLISYSCSNPRSTRRSSPSAAATPSAGSSVSPAPTPRGTPTPSTHCPTPDRNSGCGRSVNETGLSAEASRR